MERSYARDLDRAVDVSKCISHKWEQNILTVPGNNVTIDLTASSYSIASANWWLGDFWSFGMGILRSASVVLRETMHQGNEGKHESNYEIHIDG